MEPRRPAILFEIRATGLGQNQASHATAWKHLLILSTPWKKN
jgi:hypothetical protein